MKHYQTNSQPLLIHQTLANTRFIVQFDELSICQDGLPLASNSKQAMNPATPWPQLGSCETASKHFHQDQLKLEVEKRDLEIQQLKHKLEEQVHRGLVRFLLIVLPLNGVNTLVHVRPQPGPPSTPMHGPACGGSFQTFWPPSSCYGCTVVRQEWIAGVAGVIPHSGEGWRFGADVERS